MFIEVLADRPWEKDPAQGLVRVETVRSNNFANGGAFYGWVSDTLEDGTVVLIECENRLGDEKDFVVYLNPDHIVSWRYANLKEEVTW